MTKQPDFDYRYSIIPGGAVTDPDVSMRDLQVLALLGRHTNKKGWCFRSQVEMASELRCGRATVSRSIKRLVKAGWLQIEALPRGRAVLVMGEQPFSAFKYRVKIDRDDEQEAAGDGDVPKNGHHPEAAKTAPADEPKNGHGVPAIGGHGVPIQVGTLKKDLLEGPVPNSDAREGALSRWPEVWAAFQRWPNLPETSTEARTRGVWERMLADLPPPDEMLLLIAAQGDKLRLGNARRGKLGAAPATAPHNWLERDRGWVDRAVERNAQAQGADQLASIRDRIIAALGADVLAKLRRAGLREQEILALDGVTYEPGPPNPRFDCPSGYSVTVLGKVSQQLAEIFGHELRVVNAKAERRRA